MLLLAAVLLSFSTHSQAQSVKANNATELEQAIKSAVPGSEIVMANGVWKDIRIVFKAQGTAQKPIVLRAETAGKVSVEGLSDLKIGGNHLEVRGLYFQNGYTPSKTVIDFRADSTTVANHCKVTQCVIRDFNKPNRSQHDYWIEFWGRHNTLEHCSVIGKSNSGPTILVSLKGNENINNHHQIVNNHFGPRPRKGGPHGETIQIGDSYTSMAPSYTNVAYNFFDRCDGEVEVISNKSNYNVYRGNIFYHSEGSLVLRHGNYCAVDGNFFIGDGKSPAMGGVRVINTGHWITNNYFCDIVGKDFRSALAIMNGVPKSPQNRYNQVTDVVVAYNTFVNCAQPWQLSVGANMDKKDVLPAQEIRSARPERTLVANNIVYNSQPLGDAIQAYDVVDGFQFANNVSNGAASAAIPNALQTTTFTLQKRTDGLLVPTAENEEVYNGFDFETITKDLFGNDRSNHPAAGAVSGLGSADYLKQKDFGASWYAVEKAVNPATVVVKTALELQQAVSRAISGTTIVLKKGVYELAEPLAVTTQMTLKSEGKNRATVKAGGTSEAVFVLQSGAALALESLIIKGTGTQPAFATGKQGMTQAYGLVVRNCEISHFDQLLLAYKDTFADRIAFENCDIHDGNSGLSLASEMDDKGEYNAEFVSVGQSRFTNIAGPVVDYYRGGYDESTMGGNLLFQGNRVSHCGKPAETLLKTRGIVTVNIVGNRFEDNPVARIAVLWGEKKQQPSDNVTQNSGEFQVEQNLKQKMMY